MKNTLWFGTMAVLLASAAPATVHAQQVKDRDRILGDARYSEPAQAPAAQAAPVEPVVRSYEPGQYQSGAAPAQTAAPQPDPYVVPYQGTHVTSDVGTTSSDWDEDSDDYDGADFSGLYAGFDFGYVNGSHAARNPTGPDGTISVSGFEGGVYAGYGWAGRETEIAPYLGFELGYEISSAEGNLNGIDFEKENVYLATLRPGVVIGGDVLAYGILGYGITEFEGNGASEDVGTYIFGGGAEFETGTPINVRVETAYLNYDRERFSGIRLNGGELNVKAGAHVRF